jgi:hypothetical protein
MQKQLEYASFVKDKLNSVTNSTAFDDLSYVSPVEFEDIDIGWWPFFELFSNLIKLNYENESVYPPYMIYPFSVVEGNIHILRYLAARNLFRYNYLGIEGDKPTFTEYLVEAGFSVEIFKGEH